MVPFPEELCTPLKGTALTPIVVEAGTTGLPGTLCVKPTLPALSVVGLGGIDAELLWGPNRAGVLGFEAMVLVNLRFLSKSIASRVGVVLITGVVGAVCVKRGF
jgi:hypothetical protein